MHSLHRQHPTGSRRILLGDPPPEFKRFEQVYKSKIKALKPDDLTYLIFSFLMHFLLSQIDPQEKVSPEVLFEMKSALYIFERPSSEIVEWFEFAQRGESWLNGLNNKLSLVFSATLGLSELEPLERINLCMIQSPLIGSQCQYI